MDIEQRLGLGIDAGSTTTKAVLVDSSRAILGKAIIPTGASVANATLKCLDKISSQAKYNLVDTPTISTGYGRASIKQAQRTVTEITCHSVGVFTMNPEIRFLIDVGGQDAKVIRLGSNGRPEDFELNDKCSAGTGRFLEVMARVLEVTLDELGPLALQSSSPSSISSTCTVFAESEVIGHIGAGETPQDIAAGIHLSMVSKVASLSKRVGLVEPVCVTGGVARNPAFRFYLSQRLGTNLWVPDNPQITGAYGAAILALG